MDSLIIYLGHSSSATPWTATKLKGFSRRRRPPPPPSVAYNLLRFCVIPFYLYSPSVTAAAKEEEPASLHSRRESRTIRTTNEQRVLINKLSRAHDVGGE